MMQKRLSFAVGFIGCLLLTGSAWAATFESDVTDIQLMSSSLTSAQGDSPGYFVLPAGFETLSQVQVHFLGAEDRSVGLFATTSASDANFKGGFGMASTDAASLHIAGGSTALGSATSVLAESTTPWATGTHPATLFLAPETSLTVYADYHLQIEVDDTNCAFAGCQVAEAAIYISSGSQSFFDYVAKDTTAPWDGTLEKDASVTFTLSNSTDQWQQESLTVEANGYDQVRTVPIPEPCDYALMLAGLGVLGLIARRRSARRNYQSGAPALHGCTYARPHN